MSIINTDVVHGTAIPNHSKRFQGAFSMHKYCIYFTIYLGSKLPPYYVGSTKVVNINKGYRGSVSSAEYGPIWQAELKDNPHLFRTYMIPDQYAATQKDILDLEYKWQKIFDAVKSPLFVNRAYANKRFHTTQASAAKGVATRKSRGNGSIKRNPESVAKMVATRRTLGTYESTNKRIAAKRKQEGSYKTGAAKGLATKRLKGNDKHTCDSVEKIRLLKTGLRAWNNGAQTIMSYECPGSGWILGSLQKPNVDIVKGSKWWNNGIMNKRSKECPGPGWNLGSLYKPNHEWAVGTKWWNNGSSNKRSSTCPGEGWTIGKLAKIRSQ